MPREVVHWYILENAIEKVLPSQTFQDLFRYEDYKVAAYWGAMAHDYPYFDGYGVGSNVRLSEILHGTFGDDPLKLLRIPLEGLVENKGSSGYLWAAWLGMLSHYVADANIHPLVYYFTGNYHDEDYQAQFVARQRHQLFEVQLDSYMRASYQPPLDGRFAHIGRRLDAGLFEITSFLDHYLSVQRIRKRFQMREPRKTNVWLKCFRYAAFCQSLFFSSAVGSITRFLYPYFPLQLVDLNSMSSYKRSEPHEFFSDVLEYQNVVTGEPKKHRVEDLLQKSIRETVELFQMVEPILAGDTEDIDSVFGYLEGRSLSVGVVGKKESDSKFYSDSPWPEVDTSFEPEEKQPPEPSADEQA